MGLTIQRVTQTKYKLLFASLAIMAIAVQPLYGFVASQVAKAETPNAKTILAGTFYIGESKCDRSLEKPQCNSINKAIDIAENGDTIQLIGNFTTNKEIVIDKNVTINGANTSNNHTSRVEGWFNKSGSNNSIFELRASAVIKNIVIDGKKHNIHGINAWHTSGTATVKNATIKNMGNSGLVVGEQAQVAADGLTTSGNKWNAINVDKSGALLKLTGINQFNENDKIPAVYFDKWDADKVQFENGYLLDHTNRFVKSGDRAYFQSANPIEISNIVLNNQNVDSSDITTANCDPVNTARSHYVGDSLDLKSTLKPYDANGSAVTKVTYKIRKQSKGGCTSAAAYKSGSVSMSNSDGSNWITLKGDRLNSTDTVDNELYTVMVTVRDADGNESTKYVNFIADHTAPKVSIENPQEGNVVSGEVNLKGIVENESSDSIMNTYFFIANSSGEQVKTNTNKSSSPVHEMKWNTIGLEDGEYTIYFEARDKANNKDGSRAELGDSVSKITVSVDNIKNEIEEPAGNTDGNGPFNKDGGVSDLGISKMDPRSLMDDGPVRNPLDDPQSPSPNSIFNRNLALNLDDDGTTDQATTGTLGDNTVNATPNSSVKGASDEKANTGLAWYWWAIIVAALLAVIWWIAAAARKKQDA